MSQQPYEFTLSTNPLDADISKILVNYFHDLLLLTALRRLCREDTPLAKQIKELNVSLPNLERFVAFGECPDIPVETTAALADLVTAEDLRELLAVLNQAKIELPTAVKENLSRLAPILEAGFGLPRLNISEREGQCLQTMLLDPLLSENEIPFAVFHHAVKNQASSSSSSSSSSLSSAPAVSAEPSLTASSSADKRPHKKTKRPEKTTDPSRVKIKIRKTKFPALTSVYTLFCSAFGSGIDMSTHHKTRFSPKVLELLFSCLFKINPHLLDFHAYVVAGETSKVALLEYLGIQGLREIAFLIANNAAKIDKIGSRRKTKSLEEKIWQGRYLDRTGAGYISASCPIRKLHAPLGPVSFNEICLFFEQEKVTIYVPSAGRMYFHVVANPEQSKAIKAAYETFMIGDGGAWNTKENLEKQDEFLSLCLPDYGLSSSKISPEGMRLSILNTMLHWVSGKTAPDPKRLYEKIMAYEASRSASGLVLPPQSETASSSSSSSSSMLPQQSNPWAGGGFFSGAPSSTTGHEKDSDCEAGSDDEQSSQMQEPSVAEKLAELTDYLQQPRDSKALRASDSEADKTAAFALFIVQAVNNNYGEDIHYKVDNLLLGGNIHSSTLLAQALRKTDDFEKIPCIAFSILRSFIDPDAINEIEGLLMQGTKQLETNDWKFILSSLAAQNLLLDLILPSPSQLPRPAGFINFLMGNPRDQEILINFILQRYTDEYTLKSLLSALGKEKLTPSSIAVIEKAMEKYIPVPASSPSRTEGAFFQPAAGATGAKEALLEGVAASLS